MTDAPEAPREGEPERGARRSPRVGDRGSPVGSTLSIVLAVIAVIAGFLILRAVTDDDGDNGNAGTSPAGTIPGGVTTIGGSDGGDGGDSVPPASSSAGPTAAAVAKDAATVSVANASGVGGSAAQLTTALQTAGYKTGEPGNTTGEKLTTSVVYFVTGDANAQAVAGLLAGEMGAVKTEAMPATAPIDKGLGASTVLVMVGTDKANQPLGGAAAGADGATTTSAGGVAPPAAVGVTTTTAG